MLDIQNFFNIKKISFKPSQGLSEAKEIVLRQSLKLVIRLRIFT